MSIDRAFIESSKSLKVQIDKLPYKIKVGTEIEIEIPEGE
jgi:hypothetical protein